MNNETPDTPKRKRGRPKGSKNKPKDVQDQKPAKKQTERGKQLELLRNYIEVKNFSKDMKPDCLDCDKFLTCKLSFERGFDPCGDFASIYPPDEEGETEVVDA
tara:strand:+ start:6091 stop:6399 length:309 start_codon:yes stop_codon:yes gene_type:complete